MSREIIAKGRDRGWLLEPEAKELCRIYGLPVGEWRLVASDDGAEAAGNELGFPIAMKVVSPDIVHKSDVGGVVLNIKDGKEARDAYGRMEKIGCRTGARIEGALVERMAPPGVETIIGATHDLQFGPVVMFGLGGIFVEVFNDISFRVTPIGRQDAIEMISELKAYPILKGIRGRKPSDVESVIDCLLRVSSMMLEVEEIKELDLNPVIVYEKGCRIVDARIILG